MGNKIIAVLGATGTQGGSVARTFAQLPGWEVRAITRNTTSPASKKLQYLGMEVVEANLDDQSSLVAAFSGAHAIFAVTDFWQFAKDPKTHELAKAQAITWNEMCYQLESQQGINLIEAATKRNKDGGLERLVVSSLSDARRASHGKYTWVYHFDAKARYVQYLQEKAQASSDHQNLFQKTSYLQMGNYLDNWNKNPALAPQKQPNGLFVWRRLVSDQSQLHPTPFVHPPTDTGPFVEALVLRAPPQTTMLGTSSLLSFSDFVELWGRLCGVEAILETLTVDEIDELFPGGHGREVGETMAYVQEFGWDGGEGALLPVDTGVNIGALTSAESYIRETDWNLVLN